MIAIESLANLNRVRSAAGADFQQIQNEVATGKAFFCSIHGCYFVLRRDCDGLVVVCAEGKNLKLAEPVIVAFARSISAPAIIFHTKRKALARLLDKFDFLTMDSNGYHVFKRVL